MPEPSSGGENHDFVVVVVCGRDEVVGVGVGVGLRLECLSGISLKSIIIGINIVTVSAH